MTALSRPRALWAAVAGGALLTFVAGSVLQRRFIWSYPPLDQLEMTDRIAVDLGTLMLGAHHVAGDLAYIDFLQYYGVDEPDAEAEAHAASDKIWDHDMSAGRYPLMKTLGLRVMRLDPFFNAGILDVAGALAFNQKRPEEALQLLREAIQRDPSYYRYHLYVSAILYKNQGEDQKLIEVLEEAIQSPDCPPIVQGLLGNLLKKDGQYAKSAEVYLHMMDTSTRETDRHDALERLEALVKEHPEVAPVLARHPAFRR